MFPILRRKIAVNVAGNPEFGLLPDGQSLEWSECNRFCLLATYPERRNHKSITCYVILRNDAEIAVANFGNCAGFLGCRQNRPAQAAGKNARKHEQTMVTLHLELLWKTHLELAGKRVVFVLLSGLEAQ
ncbi:MAG: hypothetical protein KDJ29_04550 [Hyphomicrobiales bacterium]|nr:hypothetical protein [Hyphomicrobiales bacterium]